MEASYIVEIPWESHWICCKLLMEASYIVEIPWESHWICCKLLEDSYIWRPQLYGGQLYSRDTLGKPLDLL